jgi:hypothetical protein
MPSKNWTLSDDQTVAEYVSLDDFKGLSQNRLGITPDHVALLMRDGEIVDAYVGAHFSFGGVWQRLKDFVGGEHAIRLLVATLKPFQIQGEVDGLSKDNVRVGASIAVEFQVNPERPANILGLMKERASLTKSDIYQRLLPHLKDRIFGTVFKQVNAIELRGNAPVQDKIQADVLLETERVFKDLGVIIRAVSLTWATNDAERDAIQRSADERQQAILDYEFERKKRELTREKEATEFVLKSDLEVERLKATSEDELKQMFLKQELAFIDARQMGVREQELKKLGHELELLNIQRRSTYTKALEDALNEVDRTEIRRKLRVVELDIQKMEQLQALELQKLREEQQLNLARIREEQNLSIAERARKQQLDAMRDLNVIELDAKERSRKIDREDRAADSEMALKAKAQDSQSEIDRLMAQAKMSPDQLLAISAGLSPEVARIFTERAKAAGVEPEKREALLREMVQLTKDGRMASEEQARFFFDKAMHGVQGVASGRASPKVEDAERAEAGGGGKDPAATVECPGCHRQTPVKDRFCRYCGRQMRT